MATPAPKPNPAKDIANKKAAKKVAPRKPVTTERTGNPADKRDWTNAPGTADWAKQLYKANGGR